MTGVIQVQAKVAGVCVALLALFAFMPAATAQTEAELQAQIDQLLETIASLEAQIEGGASGTTCPALTQPMTIDSEGANVVALQDYLTSTGHFTYAGGSTGYFGPVTEAAVAAWQADNTVSPAIGYWGPVSLAKYNEVCVAEGDSGEETESSEMSVEEQMALAMTQLEGEGSLENYKLRSAPDDDIAEGESAQVLRADVEVEGGDLLLARVDFAVSGDNEEPYDYFETVTLWINGEKIRTQPVNAPAYWSEKNDVTALEAAGVNAANPTYSIAGGDGIWGSRFPSIGMILEEGETYEIMIGFEAKENAGDLPMDWYMFIDNEGIRALTADDYNVYEGDQGVNGIEEFEFEKRGTEDELNVSTSSDDPDATTLQLDSSDKSEWITVHAFDLDTDDSTNDIEIDNLYTHLAITSGTTYDNIISDVRLVVDGEEYDDWSFATGTSASSTVDFNFDIDGDLTIDAGDEVTVEMQVEFKALNSSYAGDTVTGSVESYNTNMIDAEGADDLDNSSPDQLTGSSQGEAHTLRASGVILDLVSTSESFVENDDSTTSDNEASFVIKFDVTAFDEDIYFEKTTDRSTTTSNQAVNYIIEDSNGDEVETAGTESAVLTSTATTESGYFRVNEGQTETFTLTVEYDPATAGFYSVQLHAVNYNETSTGAPDTTQNALPAEDFESDPVSI